jgi:hypothetical protein
MSRDDAAEGSRPWRVIPVLAGAVVSLPLVVGFVALGATVIVARTLRDAARETWGRLPALRGNSRDRGQSAA